MRSSLAATALAGLVLASLPATGQGAAVRVSVCGSGGSIEFPFGPQRPPARHEDGGCVLACHADGVRRRSQPAA